MSISLQHGTLGSGNTYKLETRPDMSSHEEQSTAASKPNVVNRIRETRTEFFPDLIKEKIKANLEAFQAQKSALTQMMDKLIENDSARAYPTASTRQGWLPSQSPLAYNLGPPESCC